MRDPGLNRHALELQASFDRLRRLERLVVNGVPTHRGAPDKTEALARQIRRGGTSLPSPYGGWGDHFDPVTDPKPTPNQPKFNIEDPGRIRAKERIAEAEREYITGGYPPGEYIE